ncbi:hypothetical protein [Streptomyces showdoensis]|uniref:hypothetical protein n=1 Tax=Streptomyces showdoensis TaxID=68268 RepID=UPI0031E6FAE3
MSAFDSAIASNLIHRGADPDHRLADGTTPRLRAIDSGSVGLAYCLLGDAARLDEAARVHLLERARQWHEKGAVARACALEYPDMDHAAWWEIICTVAERQDVETWEAAGSSRSLYRRFGAEVLNASTRGRHVRRPKPFRTTRP